MAADLIVAPEATTDMDQAFEWYEGRRAGLGSSFLTNVDACIQAICRVPSRHPVVMGEYRRALVRRFPYAVIYALADNTVTVGCVFHTSQNPDKWRERLS